MRYRYKRFELCYALALILLTGCASGLQSETVIIPSAESDQAVDEGSRPFQVKTIYRMPESKDAVELLGWSSSKSVVGLFYETEAVDAAKLSLQRFSSPYERVDHSLEIEMNKISYQLSPNGKYVSGIAKTEEGVFLQLIAYPGGEVESLEATTDANQELWFEEPTWSGNSRFVSYMVMESNKRQSSIGIFDTESESARVYRLKGLETEALPFKVIVSDDGKMALIVLDEYGHGRRIAMGAVNGNAIDVQYEHDIGTDQAAWLNDDQFVFLGTEGTLYVYDRRNHELSILLEKVDSYEFSKDRKYVAYSQNGENTIYAGKLQGKNILSAEPIYHGVISSKMYWSPDHRRLLVNGRKNYAKEQGPVAIEPTEHQPFIIEFK
ncbi:WD40 repeat domain-containing protein [Paenibacillus lautus]|uniref:WD40 repeat domain-containing protein n=1 Tax=Paenibacillus lautus TaxID=1401 RepID=UPI001C7CC6EA|nr:WD40 repeat domain-containing protein [Paenibacillus lautus]MBX4149019.1 WD40 repeat domain-containing protein [Paenibacillus lautus]